MLVYIKRSLIECNLSNNYSQQLRAVCTQTCSGSLAAVKDLRSEDSEEFVDTIWKLITSSIVHSNCVVELLLTVLDEIPEVHEHGCLIQLVVWDEPAQENFEFWVKKAHHPYVLVSGIT